MPEGDTIRRLADSITERHAGQLIRSSLFRHPRLATVDLTGTSLVDADARGKHLLIRFSNGSTLHVHLRMNGSVYHRFPREVYPRKRVFEIQLDSGWLTGVDLPIMEMLRTKNEGRVVDFLGPDICGYFDLDLAIKQLNAAESQPISQAMLDQRIVAGFGNIYAVETPFIVGINPYTMTRHISDLAALLAVGVGLIRTNARFGPQNTTGKNIQRTQHWVLGSRTFSCKVCGAEVKRQSGAETPWKRRTAWCVRCQPEDATVVDLERAAKLLALHPCRKIVDIRKGEVIADVGSPVVTEALRATEGSRKTMK